MKSNKKCRTPRLKRIVMLLLMMNFAVGLMIGLVVGKLMFRTNAIKPVPTEVVETLESIPTETTEATSATEAETTVIVTESVPVETEALPTEPPVMYYDCPLSYDLQDYIRELCEIEDVPMGLVIAMVDKESTFRASVVSATNDYGLMQINAVNHAWLSDQYGITDFLDPYQNVFCGIKIIGDALRNCNGNLSMALMSYNLGAGRARNLWNQGIFSTSYSTCILDTMRVYDNTMITA